jgi:hypothetical protein
MRSCPDYGSAHAASARRSFWTASQRQGPRRSGGDARMAACRPSPVCVHYWVSTQPGPPSGVQVSSRPVSSPSSVRLSGSLVRTRLSGPLVSSPSGVQPFGVRPSARSQPSRPASAGWWRWGRPRDGGAAVMTGSSRVACGPVPSPAARSTARGGMDAGTAAEVVCRLAGERRRGPGPGGASAAGCTRPTRQARPPRGRLSLATALGQGSWLARCCRTAPCGAAIWPGATTTLRGHCGA